MAILRSVDGLFYEVPDDDLDGFAVPPDQVKDKLGECGGLPGGPQGGGMGGGGGGGMPGGGLVYVQVYSNAGGGPGGGGGGGQPTGGGEGGEVEPYGHGHGWRNWRNCCWRNWRNCC